ncbi:MAG: hypothetical protein V4599_02295 [Verrucomicrobiota bacterium]
MKLHLFAAVTFGMSLLQMAEAFEPPLPSSAIFNFDDEKRSTLESYNQKHLKGHGIYKNIPLKEEDASFGDELTLKGLDVLTGYKTACAAFIPKKFQHALQLPKKDGELTFAKFAEQDPFTSITVKAKYFKIEVLESVEITVSQEGGDHIITIEIVEGGIRIRCMSSLP